jgi:beta-aspartyl-peptidase (threonine type)
VGDTPIIGAGTYCTPRVGVSLTGVGERIMVLLSAKRLADHVGAGRPLRQAAEAVIGEVEAVGSAAGLIAIDASGEMVDLRNARFMALARRA